MSPGVYTQFRDKGLPSRPTIIPLAQTSEVAPPEPPAPPAYVTDNLLIHLDAGNPASYPGTGTTWTDLTGNGYNGTLVYSPTYSTSDGGVLEFDGSYNFTTISGLDLRRDFSLEIWVKINSFSQYGPCFFSQGISEANKGLFICHFYSGYGTPGETLLYRMYSNDYDVTLTPVTPTNTWTQYIFTYTHSAPYTKKLYRDGVLNGTSGTQGQYAGTGTFNIGIGYGGGSTLNGNLAISRIYTKVLSDSEVLQNYNANKDRFGL